MKVIFLKDVPKVGRKFDIKEVSDGYAQNALIPRKLAVAATPEHVRRAEIEKGALVTAEKEKVAGINALIGKLQEEPLRLSLPANEKGHLFKGIHASDLVAAIQVQYGIKVLERELVLPTPLKDVGTHTIDIHSGSRKGVCTVVIEAKK